MTARETWDAIKNLSCPECGRSMLHIGLLPRAPFRPMQDIFHCDACQHTKLREVMQGRAAR